MMESNATFCNNSYVIICHLKSCGCIMPITAEVKMAKLMYLRLPEPCLISEFG